MLEDGEDEAHCCERFFTTGHQLDVAQLLSGGLSHDVHTSCEEILGVGEAQFGATIVHRTLANLAEMRGVAIDRTYQLNVGGNTDFLNMTEQDRLAKKRESKTEAVQAVLEDRLKDTDIRIGPSDYVPWLNDRKVAYVRLEGRLFGGARTNIEVRLDVEDSPNAAAEAIVAIRLARIALDRGLAGPIQDASAFLFKHPPEQIEDTDAHDVILNFVKGGEAGA